MLQDQRVEITSIMSNKLLIVTDIPQGSIQKPLLLEVLMTWAVGKSTPHQCFGLKQIGLEHYKLEVKATIQTVLEGLEMWT